MSRSITGSNCKYPFLSFFKCHLNQCSYFSFRISFLFREIMDHNGNSNSIDTYIFGLNVISRFVVDSKFIICQVM